MIEKFQVSALEKILNYDDIGVKKIYPMVDEIKVKYIEDDRFFLMIYLNDPEITTHNMYQKGFDPHYLIDYHFYNYFSLLGVPKSIPTGFRIYNADGELIDSWYGY